MTRIDIRAVCQHLVQEAGPGIFASGFDTSRMVEEIVDRAEGVFLWADIAMRAALVAANRSDNLLTILKDLESPPGEIQLLYDKLLGSLSESESSTAYAMLAVATLPFNLSSLAYTWLRDVPSPDFPDLQRMKKKCRLMRSRNEERTCAIKSRGIQKPF